MSADPTKIILRPVITEKATILKEKFREVCFEVPTTANKSEIKKAVEQLFKVHVVKVNTMRRKGKLKRERAARYGRTSFHKRAMVTLKAGDKIEIV